MVLQGQGVWQWRPWVAGGVAGGSMAVVGHPFDTLKTRIQADTGQLLDPCSLVVQRGSHVSCDTIAFGLHAGPPSWFAVQPVADHTNAMFL